MRALRAVSKVGGRNLTEAGEHGELLDAPSSPGVYPDAQQRCCLLVTSLSSDVKGSLAEGIWQAGVGADAHERTDRLAISVPRGLVEDGVTLRAVRLRLEQGLQQRSCNCSISTIDNASEHAQR